MERAYRRLWREMAHAARSERTRPVGDLLAKNSQNGLSGIVGGHAGVGEAADSTDDRDHRVRCGEAKAKADPVLQSRAVLLIETAVPAQPQELSRRLSEADRRGEREPLDYNAPADGFATDLYFYIDEAYHGGRLRQGWGVPELSLTHPNGVAKAPEDWMMDYLFAIWKYWSEIEIQMFRGSASAIGARLAPYARQASGRYSILNRMLRMSVGDIIFVPATSAVPGEEQDFSV